MSHIKTLLMLYESVAHHLALSVVAQAFSLAVVVVFFLVSPCIYNVVSSTDILLRQPKRMCVYCVYYMFRCVCFPELVELKAS